MGDAVKIRAKALEDISVMSSLCQDALISVADMHYDAENKSFYLILNRFCWEEVDASKPQESYSRTHSGLRIDSVTSLSSKGINKRNSDQIISLLAIAFAADEENATSGAGQLMLQFADDKALKVSISDICIALEDLGQAWQTQWLPGHEQALSS